MAAITWPQVVAIAPELDHEVVLEAQEFILDHVNTVLKVSRWGGESSPRLKLARLYLAAHYATLARLQSGAATGPVVSRSAGEVSVTYAQSVSTIVGTDPRYDSTRYGTAYQALAKPLGSGPLVS